MVELLCEDNSKPATMTISKKFDELNQRVSQSQSHKLQTHLKLWRLGDDGIPTTSNQMLTSTHTRKYRSNNMLQLREMVHCLIFFAPMLLHVYTSSMELDELYRTCGALRIQLCARLSIARGCYKCMRVHVCVFYVFLHKNRLEALQYKSHL